MANHLRLDQAEERRVAAEFDLERTQNDVALQVASAFLGLMFAEDALDIANLNVQTTETQVTRIRAFVDAGAAPEADLLDLQAQLASDQSSAIAAEGEVALARLQLAQVMRLSPADTEAFKSTAPTCPTLAPSPRCPPGRRPRRGVDCLPRGQAGESRVRQQIGMDLAKTVGLPRLSASWSYGSGFRRRARTGR